MNRPLVSVVITAYNRGVFLPPLWTACLLRITVPLRSSLWMMAQPIILGLLLRRTTPFSIFTRRIRGGLARRGTRVYQ